MVDGSEKPMAENNTDMNDATDSNNITLAEWASEYLSGKDPDWWVRTTIEQYFEESAEALSVNAKMGFKYFLAFTHPLTGNTWHLYRDSSERSVSNKEAETEEKEEATKDKTKEKPVKCFHLYDTQLSPYYFESSDSMATTFAKIKYKYVPNRFGHGGNWLSVSEKWANYSDF